MNVANKKGFTLIELSIVLVIIGLIVGTITPLIVSITKKNKITGGRQAVNTARDEIKGDFVQNRQLAVNLDSIGHTSDPWKNDLVYIPAPNLSGQDLCTWLAGGTDQTGLAVCLNGDCTNEKKDNIAFVIASIGSNFNRQFETPTNLDGNGTDLEIRIYDYGTEIDRYTTAPDPNDGSQQFDDIVQYVAADELAQLVSCSVILVNQTGQSICSGGAEIANTVDIGMLDFNQRYSLGATSDGCISIDSSCNIQYNTAQLADANMDGRVAVSGAPPACTLNDI